MTGKTLPMWTIYDHPSDYPDGFIARKWLAGANAPNGEVQATDETRTAATLDGLRDALQSREPFLVCLPRDPHDDPTIVETWL